ncbi:MAG: hypothetical protein ISQ32_01480 [Rickettsiales bacterium]|nr:hypothetical protein [Rickettsiales bacterium]
MSNQESNNSQNEDQSEYSVTDILQAHDILISILLGKMIGSTSNPENMVQNIHDMVDMQDVSSNVKEYIKMLISPVADAIIEHELN